MVFVFTENEVAWVRKSADIITSCAIPTCPSHGLLLVSELNVTQLQPWRIRFDKPKGVFFIWRLLFSHSIDELIWKNTEISRVFCELMSSNQFCIIAKRPGWGPRGPVMLATWAVAKNIVLGTSHLHKCWKHASYGCNGCSSLQHVTPIQVDAHEYIYIYTYIYTYTFIYISTSTCQLSHASVGEVIDFQGF